MASYFVRAGKKSWRLVEERWEEGIKSQHTIPRELYSTLGFNSHWSVIEAKERCKRLNQEQTLERKQATISARRASHFELIESIFIPEELAKRFTEQLQDECFGSSEHLDRIMGHWKTSQKIIKSLSLHPSQYFDRKKRVYRLLQEAKFSIDYSKKLLRIINLWGYFQCSHEGSPFRPIPPPKGKEREAISDASSEVAGRRKASKALTPEILKQNKRHLSEVNYNWLYISVWFGLRPVEVDHLKDLHTWRLEDGETQILWVYQTKLTAVPKDQRWKPIPLLFEEQITALDLLKSREFKRPAYKTMKRIFGVISCYGGRKAFTDLMLDQGQRLEDVSQWLGHRSINTTIKHYKNRMKVRFTKPA